MDFNKFTDEFAKWRHETKKAKRTGIIIGIRTDESLRRFMAITSKDKPTFNGFKWSTEVESNIYNLYPIYDWKVEDIWGAVAKFDLDYNHVYEAMYKNGVPLSKQRICQPFGMAQKAGLDQFRSIEPETWERLLQRVEGVNFGAIYCRSSLFGNISSMKPEHLTWQQYTVFLLESLGLYEPRIMRRYYEKIKYYMLWCQKNENMAYGVLPEEAPGRNASWKRMAKAIERNDFYLSYLEFGPDKKGDELLIELQKEHRMRLEGDGRLQPKIQKRLQQIESEFQKGGNDEKNK
jgi:predicted phosphoadenosine phosphosulfate sulfurtransferase